MQKHEVESVSLAAALTLPIVGCIAGAYAGGVPLLPFPEALNAALQATPHGPWFMTGPRLQVINAVGGRSSQLVASPPEPVVMDSEISNLRDLEGYVMFAEDFPVTKIKVPYVKYGLRATPSQIRER
jgi:Type IV secretion-system coupling protein DNA-binding domain